MIVCDLTHAYTPTSGGIRTYLDAKRRYIAEETAHRHVLLIPGDSDRVVHEGRLTTVRIESPVIPGAAPYRFFVRPAKIVAALREGKPDLIELGSLYPEAWAAFSYRKRHAPRTAVAGYYHTDLPGAYVGPAVTGAAGRALGGVAERATARYVRAIFGRCDLALAPSPPQAERLASLGIAPVTVVPLGVDLDLFNPTRRDPALRASLGIPDGGLLLVYAGRLDSEKRVSVLADAVSRLPEALGARLAVIGNGPHRPALEARAASGEPILVLPFQEQKSDVARLLASSDVYVTAGPHETFGLSVVEAQACGLPVVGVRAGALVERVPDSVGRLGPVDDAEAFAANVETVAVQRTAMGRAARQLVEELYSWRATFRALFTAYDAAVRHAQTR